MYYLHKIQLWNNFAFLITSSTPSLKNIAQISSHSFWPNHLIVTIFRTQYLPCSISEKYCTHFKPFFLIESASFSPYSTLQFVRSLPTSIFVQKVGVHMLQNEHQWYYSEGFERTKIFSSSSIQVTKVNASQYPLRAKSLDIHKSYLTHTMSQIHQCMKFLNSCNFLCKALNMLRSLRRGTGWVWDLEEAGPTGLHKPLYQGENWSTNTSGVCNTNSQVLWGHLATFQKLGFAKNTRTFYTNLLLRWQCGASFSKLDERNQKAHTSVE